MFVHCMWGVCMYVCSSSLWVVALFFGGHPKSAERGGPRVIHEATANSFTEAPKRGSVRASYGSTWYNIAGRTHREDSSFALLCCRPTGRAFDGLWWFMPFLV